MCVRYFIDPDTSDEIWQTVTTISNSSPNSSVFTFAYGLLTVFVGVLILDYRSLKHVDYPLLLTFSPFSCPSETSRVFPR